MHHTFDAFPDSTVATCVKLRQGGKLYSARRAQRYYGSLVDVPASALVVTGQVQA